MKRCTRCGIDKDLNDFHRKSSLPDGRRSECKACANERTRTWTEAYRERKRATDRRRTASRHGINQEGIAAMLAEQGNGCAICGVVDPGRRRFAVDHDHSCCAGKHSCGRCVRGLLCCRCNSVLAFALDDPNRLRAAAQYLETRKAPDTPLRRPGPSVSA